MNRTTTRLLLLLFLAAVCFSLATVVEPRSREWNQREDSGGVLKVLLGDSRRLFADQFFAKADESFHGGYYPTFFEQAHAPKNSRHMTAQEGSPEEETHEKQMAFLGPPKDWIEGFGRHFRITQHTHLEGGKEREILPWLKVSAELDPHRIDTYTVASFWLRRELGRVREAENFLREGLRNNPKSYEILFELGCLYKENDHDAVRARNVWEAALRRWRETQAGQKEPDLFVLDKIAVNLARLEEEAGHWDQAIRYLEMAAEASPNPQALRQQIAELKQKAIGPGR